MTMKLFLIAISEFNNNFSYGPDLGGRSGLYTYGCTKEYLLWNYDEQMPQADEAVSYE